MTHICVSKLTIIGSDNGLSPGRRQAIIWTNAGILLIGPLRTNFSEIFIKIHAFSFKNMRLKMSSAKWRPFCLGLNVLMIRVFSVPLSSQFPCRSSLAISVVLLSAVLVVSMQSNDNHSELIVILVTSDFFCLEANINRYPILCHQWCDAWS